MLWKILWHAYRTMDCLRLILDAEIVQDLRIDPTLLVGTCPPPFGAPTVIIKPEPAREEFLILPTTPSTTCGGATGAPMAKEEPCHETDGAVESDSAPIVAAKCQADPEAESAPPAKRTSLRLARNAPSAVAAASVPAGEMKRISKKR